jgi:enoyl-CoA hydratase/carnithine racemase
VTDAAADSLLVRRDGDVVVLTFNRPERRNALDRTMFGALTEQLRSADRDAEVGVVVLTGAPPAFCAGADLDELKTLSGDDPRALGPVFEELLDTLAAMSVPLVAAVDGAAVGLGATLLLHCDVVVAGDSARLRFPFVALGVTVEAGAGALLPSLVGTQQAARLLLTGCWVDADEAVGLGLVALRAPVALPVAIELAQSVAAQPREAVRTTRQLLAALRRPTVEAARVEEREAWSRLQNRRPHDPR